MVSLAPTTEDQRSHIISALSEYPSLVRQVLASLDLPIKPPDYHPVRLEVHFNGQLILLQENGFIVYEVSGFAPSYRPKVMSIHCDGELLFVSYRNEILLNRLPQLFVTGWKTYAS